VKYLIVNADTPTGFYLINRLMLRNDEYDAILIGDGYGDNFIHPEVNYTDPSTKELYRFKNIPYDGIFVVSDSHRLYEDFVTLTYTILSFNIPIVAIFDWEMFNGVKRGNFPISTATPTNPDSYRGICKVWMKDMFLHASKHKSISVMVTPSVLSPFHLTETVRKGAEYYLAQKLWEVLESFKSAEPAEINKGDLRVIYDIVHNTDVAHAAIDLFDREVSGYFMLSSNEFLRFSEILEMFYGRLIQSSPIKFKNTGMIVKNKRRTLENYDTSIDMVWLWSDVIYYTPYKLKAIFDDIIHVLLNSHNDYDIVENVMMHLIL